MINLNNKRKKIETLILNSINFDKIENDNKDIIFYYDPNMNEGLIGIIAAKLKDYFHKPTVVITKSKNILKCSARSIYNYNIGKIVRNSLQKKIILNGGGHNMAAGFTLKEKNLPIFKDFVLEDFFNKNISLNSIFEYDAQITSSAFNKDFFDEIKRIGPFGSGNPSPIFLIKNLKIIKTKILNQKYVSCILKSKAGPSINSISFHSCNSKIGINLLNYKKYLSVIGHINENFWNNKKTLQLIIKDLIL